MKWLANIITLVLHPFTLTLPAVFFIVFNATRSTPIAFYWTVLSLLFSGTVALFVIFGVKLGLFNNLDVSNRRQRIFLYPFLILVALLFALFVTSQKGPNSLVVISILLVIFLLIMDVVNTRIKASIHVASVAAIAMGIIFQNGGWSYLLLILIPLTAWARIREHRHTLRETVTGGFMGIALSITTLFIVQFIG